jgi:DNA-damage-inducible protein D
MRVVLFKNVIYICKKIQITMAKTKLTKTVNSIFEQIRRIDEKGNEYWSAREFAKALEYVEYRNFIPTINRAKEACVNSGLTITDHFVDINELIIVGKGAERQVDSIKLSRYACYLIVQNADPSKEAIALGQTYFAVQTRLQEIKRMQEYNALTNENEKRLFLRNELRRHNSQLADTAHNAGVIDAVDYAIFQNFGYKGLYGGLDATEEKLHRENIKGKQKANQTHYEVGTKVRKTIKDLGGTMPEDLPTAESIKKLEQKENKKLKT